MRARLTSLLLVTAGVVGVGCASKPVNEPSAMVAEDHACATSSTASQAHDHDTDIDAILMQPTSDQRLTRINRQMYQSLRALDSELRRQERLAGCESHAQASAPGERGSDASVAAGAVVGGTARSNADGAIGTSATAASLTLSPSGAGTSGTAPGAPAPHATSTRKASLSSGRGGNGATAPKAVSGSDNDIVARRLRKAAEQETNPALRAKLWKEYTDYRQGTSAK